MSTDLDRLLRDAAASPDGPVDVEALHTRAQRGRRRDQVLAGLGIVALVAVLGTAVLALIGDGRRVDLAPADPPGAVAAPGWPLRMRAEVILGPPGAGAVPMTIQMEGAGWDDWLAVTAHGPADTAVPVFIETADGRQGRGDGWTHSADEPFGMLEAGAEAIAGSRPSEDFDLDGRLWWLDTRPAATTPHPLPHALLRPWRASVEAAPDPVGEADPGPEWQDHLAAVAERLGLDPSDLTVAAWTVSTHEECPSTVPQDCLVTITAVLLEDADLPLLVELWGGGGWSGELTVTHLDLTGHPEPAPAEGIRVVPSAAQPGSTVELFFPEGNERGVAFTMSELVDGAWVPRYTLISEPAGYTRSQEAWTPDGQGEGWEDIGVEGPGPDPVDIPDIATPGRYRICTVEPAEELCGEMTVTSGQGEAPESQQTDPVALIGLWEVVDAGDEPGAVLRLDVGDVRLFRQCGGIDGSWAGDHHGAFIAEGWGWSGECGDNPWPDWLAEATTYRHEGDGHLLLDEAGMVLARLEPGEEPTLPPTMAQSLAAPPVVTEDTRRRLAPRAPLPDGYEPADGGALLGRWIPTDAPAVSLAQIQLHADGTWRGSDGCNGASGRWRPGPDGALLTTGGGPMTGVGCENIPIDSRVSQAARAGFDAQTLVLFDRHGTVLGRFERSSCAPLPDWWPEQGQGFWPTAEEAARAVPTLPSSGTLEERARTEDQVMFEWVTDAGASHRIFAYGNGPDRWGVETYEECAPSGSVPPRGDPRSG